MRVGYFNVTLDFSVRIYIDNVVKELESLGVQCIPFDAGDKTLPDVDVYWDPRLTGGTSPWYRLRFVSEPVVSTIHGPSPLGVWPWEYYATLKAFSRGYSGLLRRLIGWRHWWNGRCTAIITVSEYSAQVIQRLLIQNQQRIDVIPHGIDHGLFNLIGPSPEVSFALSPPYFLHVSSYQPVKNIHRIVNAYLTLPLQHRPRLVLVIPGYPHNKLSDYVEIIRSPIEHEQLVDIYRHANALVFPSLHESFGLPILEAMASGCPVITSNVTACPEVAGDAAILVNPRSVYEIAIAMQRLAAEPDLRAELRQRGLERASQFTWRKSAEQHLEVFESVLREQSRP